MSGSTCRTRTYPRTCFRRTCRSHPESGTGSVSSTVHSPHPEGPRGNGPRDQDDPSHSPTSTPGLGRDRDWPLRSVSVSVFNPVSSGGPLSQKRYPLPLAPSLLDDKGSSCRLVSLPAPVSWYRTLLPATRSFPRPDHGSLRSGASCLTCRRDFGNFSLILNRPTSPAHSPLTSTPSLPPTFPGHHPPSVSVRPRVLRLRGTSHL